jgi:hypothetical protein
MSKSPVVIYATSTFLRKFGKLVGEAGRLALYQHLEKNPGVGQLIPGSGGIRKLRWSRPGMGKRGGVRVIYYLFDDRGLVSLLTVYAKSEQDDLSKQEVKALAAVVEQIRRELEGDDASQ